MQKVRGHLHSDSTPSWPTDHVARKGREMRHRCSPVLHAPRDINAGRKTATGSAAVDGTYGSGRVTGMGGTLVFLSTNTPQIRFDHVT